MPQTVTYDVETSGLATQFDVPLQFAAIVQSEAGQEISRANWRGRPLRHVLPSPGALAVTNQRISDVMSAPLSHYQLMTKIHGFMDEHSPSTISAFNGIKYDEEILRHSFYGTLRNPYVTQFGGNSRHDVLRALRVVPTVSPNALTFPENAKGKLSFKLEDVASANGFNGHAAHDALGDVEATIFLSQQIREKAPLVARACSAWRNKERMLELLEGDQPIVEFGWNHMSNKPIARALMPIAFDNTNPNECICISLEADVDKLLLLSPDSLKNKFRSYKGITPLRCIKANAMPTIAPIGSRLAGLVDVDFDPADVAKIRAADGFADRVKKAADIKKAAYDEPTHVRQKLYSGGFFPTDLDRDLFRRFHASEPALKYEVSKQLRDARARELAFWLIGSEWPEVMSEADRASYEEQRFQHLMAEEANWMTIPGALAEIEDMSFDATAEQSSILDEYETYLRKYWDDPRRSAA